MGNSPSKILFRLRSQGHITEEEYEKLRKAIALANESKEPTQFIHIGGNYGSDVYCNKCKYETTAYKISNANYCPKCGRTILRFNINLEDK